MIHPLTASTIQPIGVGSSTSAGPTTGMQAPEGPSFKDTLLKSIQDVDSLQKQANNAVEQMATGGNVTPAEVLSAVQKADIAFRLMMQIRNKLVQAYQDVQQIRV
jgi:flagellar hook-basal body complex protein FliE